MPLPSLHFDLFSSTLLNLYLALRYTCKICSLIESNKSFWIFRPSFLVFHRRFCPYTGEYGSVKARILAYFVHWQFSHIWYLLLEHPNAMFLGWEEGSIRKKSCVWRGRDVSWYFVLHFDICVLSRKNVIEINICS